jgi:hypothetical protein
LNGAIAIAASGIRTQIQLAISSMCNPLNARVGG